MKFGFRPQKRSPPEIAGTRIPYFKASARLFSLLDEQARQPPPFWAEVHL
jgi:hypothetical protein